MKAEHVFTDMIRMENRRTGKTEMAIDFCRKSGAVLICANKRHADQIAQNFGIKTMSISAVKNTRGMRGPTYYDADGICELIGDMLGEIKSLKMHNSNYRAAVSAKDDDIFRMAERVSMLIGKLEDKSGSED